LTPPDVHSNCRYSPDYADTNEQALRVVSVSGAERAQLGSEGGLYTSKPR
jgi:hypothetical protein